MVVSRCSNCGHHVFEFVDEQPIGANYKHRFLRCNGCGSVISASDYFDTGYLIKQLEFDIKDKLAHIERKLDDLLFEVRQCCHK